MQSRHASLNQSQWMYQALFVMYWVNYWWKVSTVGRSSQQQALKKVGRTEITWQFWVANSLLTWWDEVVSVCQNESGIASHFKVKIRFKIVIILILCIELHVVFMLTVVRDTCWIEICHCNMDRCLTILWIRANSRKAANFETGLRETYSSKGFINETFHC